MTQHPQTFTLRVSPSVFETAQLLCQQMGQSESDIVAAALAALVLDRTAPRTGADPDLSPAARARQLQLIADCPNATPARAAAARDELARMAAEDRRQALEDQMHIQLARMGATGVRP